MVRKILIWGFAIFLIYFAAHNPIAASNVAKFLIALLASLANGLSDFAAAIAPK